MRALEDYVEVHVRIGQFWEKYPDGSIHTVLDFPDENTVRCEARVYREPPEEPIVSPAATGHAEEKRDVGHVNKTSAVENCETSAVGRALALMGFSIHKGIASREEVEIAQRKAGAHNDTQKAAGGLPDLYVDCLRLAIHSKDPSEAWPDADEWAGRVGSATSKEAKEQLVKQLEALAVDVGLKPELIKERWAASRQASA